MKKNLMGVAAAVLAMSMSMPAFAHEVTVKGGTNNTPEPTVEHEENLHGFNDVDKKDNATVNKAVDKNAVVGVGNNKLEGDEIITIEDLAVMLWSMEGSPVTPGKIAPAAVNACSLLGICHIIFLQTETCGACLDTWYMCIVHGESHHRTT